MSKTVLVSAGHCTIKGANYDPGAVSPDDKYAEAALALRLRDKVAAHLRAKKINVLEDGADGISEPLTKAIAMAKSASIAVEFHFNSFSNPKATGIEVLALPAKRTLSQTIARVIADETKLVLRGGDGGYKNQNSGQHARLGFCMAGGVIVELCFISNPADMKAYLAAEDRIAERIADVLAKAAN